MKNHPEVLVASVLLVFSVVAVASFSDYAQPLNAAQPDSPKNQTEIKVINNVDILEIVGTKSLGPRFVVVVRNRSQKVINSFFVSSANEAWQLELIYSDTIDSVPPQAEFEIAIPLNKSVVDTGLIIEAALFENGGGAGLPKSIKVMEERRRGEKLALTKGKKILDDFISKGEFKSKDKFEELKQKFILSDSVPEPSLSESMKLGMDLGKQRFLQNLERLSQAADAKPANLELEFGQLMSRLQKYVSKL